MNLQEIKECLRAWERHRERFPCDRDGLLEWLEANFDARELALALDCQLAREDLWRAFIVCDAEE